MKIFLIAINVFFMSFMVLHPEIIPAQARESGQSIQNQPLSASDEPGSEPAGANDLPLIQFTHEKQQFTGVVIRQAEIRNLTKKIRSVGIVEYNEQALVTVNAKFEGWIEKLHVNYTGKMVKKGDKLAEIYSPELYATQQEYLTLKKWAKEHKSADASGQMMQKDSNDLLAASRNRFSLWDISADQISQIEKTGFPVRTVKIYSPASGYIQSKPAVQGMKIMPGEKLFDIADLSTLWIIADIHENDLAFIRTGQKVKITINSFPGKTIDSEIDYIYPDLSQETRTVKARLTLKNPDSFLKPKMFTNLEIETGLGKRLVVPDQSIIDTGLRKLVYVLKDPDSFEPREVSTGISGEGMSEIISGLKEGEKVAASGNFLIDSEAQLKGIIPAEKH